MRKHRQEALPSWQVVGWLDSEGNLVPVVEDRFTALYLFRDLETNEEWTEPTIAEGGMGALTLQDVMTLGFTTQEYLAILDHHRKSSWGEWISSEDELDKCFDGSQAPRSGLKR
jgi:hypothetical protein